MKRENPKERDAGLRETPPAARFRLVRYFTVSSLAAFVLVVAALLHLESQEGDFLKQVQQEQHAFFARVQDGFAKQQEETARRDLLTMHEAGNVNLTRLFANALWEKDFAPLVAKVQRLPAAQCRVIADAEDAGGKTVQPGEKKTCYAGIGKQIMAFPEFRALDAQVFKAMKKSTVFKLKVYDLRGITAYSSEHNQIGVDTSGNAGWKSAAAGKPASQLTFRGRFNSFEGEVENRDLISSYLPVFAAGSEKIVGVFEVYADVTPFVKQINATSAQVSELGAANRTKLEQAAAANQDRISERANRQLVIVLGLLALLYCALWLTVRRGQRVIDEQDVERKHAKVKLTTLAAELEEKVAERTAELAIALEAATAADRMKSEFMANVTHELRTPLNSVIGFAELLKDEVPGPLNERQAQFAADILASGEQLLKLVEGILEVSRFDVAGAALEREPVEIGAALEERVAAHRRAAAARRVGIALEVAPDAGRVELDPKALRRMLDALLDNAIKFNREGGAVAVSARREGGWLEIAVTDTGIGIAREDLAKLFRPLAQLDAGLARRRGGVGLGLALARRLAELHGGTIEVESEPGKGSTFTLRFPMGEKS